MQQHVADDVMPARETPGQHGGVDGLSDRKLNLNGGRERKGVEPGKLLV